MHYLESTLEAALPLLADGAFDLIMMTSVLEHLWQPGEALIHCHRLLKSDGILFVNVPTWRGKFFLEFSAFRLGTSPALEMDDHKMYYDKRDLWPLLVQAGFKPSRIHLKYHKFGLNLFATVRG
jgi:SAM-dependent methyltransferase